MRQQVMLPTLPTNPSVLDTCPGRRRRRTVGLHLLHTQLPQQARSLSHLLDMSTFLCNIAENFIHGHPKPSPARLHRTESGTAHSNSGRSTAGSTRYHRSLWCPRRPFCTFVALALRVGSSGPCVIRASRCVSLSNLGPTTSFTTRCCSSSSKETKALWLTAAMNCLNAVTTFLLLPSLIPTLLDTVADHLDNVLLGLQVRHELQRADHVVAQSQKAERAL